VILWTLFEAPRGTVKGEVDDRPHPPLRCPVSAFGGLYDKEVRREEIEAWSSHTVGPFDVNMLPGDHSFSELKPPSTSADK